MRRLSQSFLLFSLLCLSAQAAFIAREGKGFLEKQGRYYILHVKGKPYEMGYQHGKLLRSQIQRLLDLVLHEMGEEVLPFEVFGRKIKLKAFLNKLFEVQTPFYKERFLQEMQGLADGACVPLTDVQIANHLPELFHCSGFALMGAATADGEVLHGRILDYMTDKHLQDFPVLVVAEPEGRNAFLNVSFAGFLGSVTGMNEKQIAIGEMGGGGQLFWAGEPMAFLVRRVLEEADSLREALSILQNSPRTCEYYYVISSGSEKRALGIAATWQDLYVLKPGEYHRLLPEPITDCVVLSAGDRYRELVKRIRAGYGRFDPESAIRLMDAPVAMKENLHNALMKPKTGDMWAAYAGKDGSGAWKQPYLHVNLFKLLGRKRSEPARTFLKSR